MFGFPTIIVQLVWLAIPIFTLLISIKAREKQASRGGNLRVVGSAILALSALGNAAMQMGMISGSFGVDAYGSYYMVSNVVSLVGQALFLVGLYQFVEGVRSSTGDRDLLDHLPD